MRSKIDPSLTPIFAFYNIDPENKLVGDTPCGIQKYINYMILDTNAFVDGGCPSDNSGGGNGPDGPDGPDYTAPCLCKP